VERALTERVFADREGEEANSVIRKTIVVRGQS